MLETKLILAHRKLREQRETSFEFEREWLRGESKDPDIIIRDPSAFEVLQGIVGHVTLGDWGDIDAVEFVRPILVALLLEVQIERLL